MRPSRLLLCCVALLLATGLLLGVLRALEVNVPDSASAVMWGVLLGTLAIAVIDAALLVRTPAVRLQRRLPRSLALGRWVDVEFLLDHDQSWPLKLTLYEHLPDSIQERGLPLTVELPPGSTTRLGYGVRPLVRGCFELQRTELQLASRLGLWRLRRFIETSDSLRVYPDLQRLPNDRLLSPDQWLGQLGINQRPRRGPGLEFHQLREYREGDSLRQMDWKATARQRKPIAREYQDERDQQIVLLLDCGRRLRSQDDDIGHFDHALNACLLLSQVALRQGDAVGLMTFASDVPIYIAPRKGQVQLNVLLKKLYDVHSSQRPADFSAAADAFLSRQPRRALVIWVSNLREEDDPDILAAFKRVSRQHRVLVASLREGLLDSLRAEPVRSLDEALSYCGAIDYLNARETLHERLSASGMTVLDVRPDQLGAQLVTRYLAWKKAGTL